MVTRWYPSKIDAWLAVVLAIAPVMCVFAAITATTAGANVFAALSGAAFVPAIYLGLVFPMRYGITDDALVIRHGLVRQYVPLSQITDVRPTHNPLSSPALSLDRLRIAFGEGFFKAVMISPKEKDEFMRELSARAGLHRVGDHWAR
jgi:hypothetical protein